MRLSIAHKLMLALLGLTLVVLIATLGLARWSFERGFLDYVNALEQTRLTRMSHDLARIYIENGNQWAGIDARRLSRYIRQVPGHHPPPHRGGRPASPPPEKRIGQPSVAGEKPFGRAPPPDRKRQPSSDGGRGPVTVLIDLQGNQIAGPAFASFDEELINVPVVVAGETVGVLKSQPKRKLDSTIETTFSQQQWITSGVIGIASLLLAALVSWGLVGILLSPVRCIIGSINRLSKGDYSQSLTANRQDELGQLMGDINHLTQTLEQNQTARNRWIADISHELRTPLAVLTGEIEALKDGIRPFDQAQLFSLDQEIQRLRHLTDDLYELSVSDIGGLRYQFSDIDLTQVIEQVIAVHRAGAEDADIALAFKPSDPAIISADNRRIEQLLSNLIRNSLVYTDAPGRILFSLETDANQVILSINDTPPGVTEPDCEKLFEPLYREDASRTRRDVGAGLGLAICRNIVEAHRGSIHAKPSTLGGLCIVIHLPLAKQEAK